jgi:UDP-3-O-[3-hydroxymyristoyl] glucosamine N-acyltransferase
MEQNIPSLYISTATRPITAGHLEVGAFATIAGKGGVTKSLEGGKMYAGFPAIEIKAWRKMQAVLMRLVKKR